MIRRSTCCTTLRTIMIWRLLHLHLLSWRLHFHLNLRRIHHHRRRRSGDSIPHPLLPRIFSVPGNQRRWMLIPETLLQYPFRRNLLDGIGDDEGEVHWTFSKVVIVASRLFHCPYGPGLRAIKICSLGVVISPTFSLTPRRHTQWQCIPSISYQMEDLSTERKSSYGNACIGSYATGSDALKPRWRSR